jgi:hypothetical protein
MKISKAAPNFPYDHLAILGFEKMKPYIPEKTDYLASIISPADSFFAPRKLLPATKEHPHIQDYTPSGFSIPIDMREETDDEYRQRIFAGLSS